MSTKKKTIVSTTARTSATASKPKTASTFQPKNNVLIFGKQNYLLMLIGLAMIGFGLMLMSGGSMPDPNTWDESLIYSKRRTLAGPIVIILGLVVEIFAIFINPGKAVEATTAEEQA